MSKKGRGRRTNEQRLASRDVRSTVGLVNRLQTEINEERVEEFKADPRTKAEYEKQLALAEAELIQ